MATETLAAAGAPSRPPSRHPFGAADGRGAWTELCAADPSALACQTPEWIDALCRAGFEDVSRLYRTASGQRMLLPLVGRRRRGPRGLTRLASLPGSWGMGGLIAEAPPSVADVSAVLDDLARLPAAQVIVRPNPLHAERWAAAARDRAVIAIPRTAHVLDLAGGPERVWQDSFTASARRAVRKAEREGLEVRSSHGPDLLGDFRRLFDLSVLRWARAQNEPAALAKLRAYRRDPPAKFLHIADALADRLRVCVAYSESVPVAGVIVLLGANASYIRGAMDQERLGSLRANELLHWSAIQEACARGCRHYHMGETAPASSLARFKEKFGARPVSYAEYRIERFPLTPAQAFVRDGVKRAIGFRDA